MTAKKTGKGTRQVVGSSTFRTFAYLLGGARSLQEAASSLPRGAAHCRVSSVLFAAFAVEACLNHIGEEQLTFWAVVERKLSWADKLQIIADHLGVEIDRGTRPFQTVKQAFGFRDKLAHGRTEHEEISADQVPEINVIPQWLSELASDAMAERVHEDARTIIKLLLEKSGRGDWLAVVSAATYFEGPDEG